MNNKFYYKVASCWLFLLSHTTMHGSMNIKIIKMLTVGLKSHHENLAGLMIHRLNPRSRVHLWTPILD